MLFSVNLSPQTVLFQGGIGYRVAVDATGRWVAVGVSSTGGQIGYSDDGGETWTLSSQTVLFQGSGGSGNGVAVDATGRWVAVGASSTGGQIGYSDDGETWTLSSQTVLFQGSGGRGNGVAVDATGRWVAVGVSSTGGQIGYSDNGGETWTLSSQTVLFQGGIIGGLGIAVDKNRRWVAVGNSNLVAQIGYSDDDGETWTLSSQTVLFQDGNGVAVAVDATGRWVAVGNNSTEGEIGYSDNGGETWTLSSQTVLFQRSYEVYASGIGIAVDTNGLWIAVGTSGFVGQIGYSDNGGETWTLSPQTVLFQGGTGWGVAIDTNGRWVAVGASNIPDSIVGQIGYGRIENDPIPTPTPTPRPTPTPEPTPSDSFIVQISVTFFTPFTEWTKTNTTSALAQIATTSGNNNVRLTSLTSGSTLLIAQVLYINTYAEAVATKNNLINIIFTDLGTYVITSVIIIQPVMQSNICFPAGTLIRTDQGEVAIEQLKPGKHTLGQQTIKHITKTISTDKYLIRVEQNAFGKNKPIKPTVMSKDHKIEYQGELVPAYRFLDYLEEVKKVKYSGEILYNVLLSEHGTMIVNNLRCETLDPTSPIGCLYLGVTYKKEQSSHRLV